MKRILSFIIILFALTLAVNAQAPQSFLYQGVAHNFDGTPVANKQITVEVTILQGQDCNSGCTTVWQELHYPVTNELGIFNIEIGTGQSTYAGTATSFDQINWQDRTAGDYYLKIRVDFGTSDFGNSMIDLGTSKILSVPYALVSDQAGSLVKNGGKVNLNIADLSDVDTAGITSNDILVWDGSNWIMQTKPVSGVNTLAALQDVDITSPTDLQALMYNSASQRWINTQLLLNSLNDVSISNPVNYQTIIYNTVSGNWENTAMNLGMLGNVSISSATSGDILSFDGTNWINKQGVWKASGGLIIPGDAYSTYPVYLGRTSAVGNAALYDSVGTKDFVVEGTGTFGTVPASYPNNTMIYYGDYASLVIGSSNVNGSLGLNSLIMGNGNDAQGTTQAFVFGDGNTVGGSSTSNLYVFGDNNTSNSYVNYNFVVGEHNYAMQYYNFFFGAYNQQQDFFSGDSLFAFTVGNHNTNYRAFYAATFGSYNQNYGYYSLVTGDSLVNKIYGAIVLGKFNAYSDTTEAAKWKANDPIFVVGNGTSDANRHNSVTITKDGDLYLSGATFTGVPGTTPGKKSSAAFNASDYIMSLKIYPADNKFYIDPSSMQTVFPSLVRKFNNSYAIDNAGLVPVLIKTVQEQQETIKEQEKRIKELESRLDKLENIVNQLANQK